MEVKEIYFPYNKIREGQEPFIKVIKTALEHKKNVLAHVPTGLGKTAAVLSPSLKYAIENNKTVVFLTPRHTQHRIAIETLKVIKKKYNLNFQAVDFIGKKWMCARNDIDFLSNIEFIDHCKELRKNKACEYYENYYDKSKFFKNKNLLREISNLPMHVENVVEVSKEAKVCPFEVSADIAKKAKIVIADYFHFLNPIISIK